MGQRKHLAAEARKEERKSVAVASLKGVPTSPRKMRIVADTIRGVPVDHALNLLKFSKKEAARKLEKLLQSAIFNWQAKNEGERADDCELYVKKIFVDAGVTLKRFQAAPQGRAYRIRKRSNKVNLELGSKVLEGRRKNEAQAEANSVVEAENKVAEKTPVKKEAKTPAKEQKTKKSAPKAKSAKKDK